MAEPSVYKLYLQPGMKLVLVVVFIVVAGITAGIAIPAYLHGLKGPRLLPGVIPLAVIAVIALRFLRLPHQITLSTDGTVEFLSLLGRRTVRAEEIRSIKPEGGQFGFFMVRTDRSRIRLLAQFDGFHDFLARLKTQHPGVELRGC